MKKLAFLTMIMMSSATLCFAQPATTTSTQAIKSKVAVGKVDSVVLADAVKNTKAQIVIVQDNGTKMNFTVPVSAIVRDSDSSIISLSKVSKDKMAQVEYQMAASGGNEAISVKLLK